MALAPDMSGVCRVAGTFDIQLKAEEYRQDQNNVRNTTSTGFTLCEWLEVGNMVCFVRNQLQILDCLIHDFTAVGNETTCNNVVCRIQIQRFALFIPILSHEIEQVG